MARPKIEVGTRVWVTGYQSYGILKGEFVGYTKSGMYRVKVDPDSQFKANEIVRSTWVEVV